MYVSPVVTTGRRESVVDAALARLDLSEPWILAGELVRSPACDALHCRAHVVVRYHSPAWESLVENGFFTVMVDAHGVATMERVP